MILTERSDELDTPLLIDGDLYKVDDRRNTQVNEDDAGPSILWSEMEEALRKMKWKKAEGSDGIVVEMVEAAVDIAITKIVDLANKIYETGEIPEIRNEAKFTVIPKI